jgi:CRISPR-associated protein Cas1
MIKRTLYFSNPAQIRLKDNHLVAEVTMPDNEIRTVSAPVEDIGIVVLDHPQITLTSGIIEALQNNNSALITCDKRHMPHSLLLPLEGNSTQQERYEAQLEASLPLKKQLRAQTVEAKIKKPTKTFRTDGASCQIFNGTV